MHPEAPDLKEVVGELTPAQLFWIIKNGMTGMPSFAQAGAKDDKIWSIATFVKKLPGVSEADYKIQVAHVVTATHEDRNVVRHLKRVLKLDRLRLRELSRRSA